METERKDMDLKFNVEEELEWEPSIDASDNGIGVENGVVTVMGYVKSYAEKNDAERVTKDLKGVRAIAQELEGRFAGNPQTKDDQIAQRDANVLDWDVNIADRNLQAKVQKGYVTLTGDVDWRYQF